MQGATALIGVGNIGSALVRGLIQSRKATGQQIVVFDIDRAKCQSLEKDFQITIASAIGDAIRPDTEILVLAVKPQIMRPVLDEVAARIQNRPLVVSVAAGISTNFILGRLHPKARVIRAMPTAAALIGKSITALCRAGGAGDDDLERAAEIFNAIGRTVMVEERLMNAVTALSASGLGYIFVIMEALTDAGVGMGLDRATSRELTIWTMLGAAALAAETNTPFGELKERITTPGGTTMAGLQVLERAGLRGMLIDAVEAATKRAEELQTHA
jgi:pyrroline-5-carboxylate reductase